MGRPCIPELPALASAQHNRQQKVHSDRFYPTHTSEFDRSRASRGPSETPSFCGAPDRKSCERGWSSLASIAAFYERELKKSAPSRKGDCSARDAAKPLAFADLVSDVVRATKPKQLINTEASSWDSWNEAECYGLSTGALHENSWKKPAFQSTPPPPRFEHRIQTDWSPLKEAASSDKSLAERGILAGGICAGHFIAFPCREVERHNTSTHLKQSKAPSSTRQVGVSDTGSARSPMSMMAIPPSCAGLVQSEMPYSASEANERGSEEAESSASSQQFAVLSQRSVSVPCRSSRQSLLGKELDAESDDGSASFVEPSTLQLASAETQEKIHSSTLSLSARSSRSLPSTGIILPIPDSEWPDKGELDGARPCVQSARSSFLARGTPVRFYVAGEVRAWFGRVRNVTWDGTYVIDSVPDGRRFSGVRCAIPCAEEDLQQRTFARPPMRFGRPPRSARASSASVGALPQLQPQRGRPYLTRAQSARGR